MTTISTTATSQLYAQRPPAHAHGSEKSRLTATISDEVSAGSLSGTDATALTNALGAIDASLSSDGTASTGGGSASGSTGSTASKLDPSSIKDRINGLISDQVSNGTLTSDQATELKNLFSSHGQSTQSSDATGDVADAGGPPPGGPPPEGPPPGPPPNDAASSSSSSDGSTSTSTTSASDLLSAFVQQLQASQSSKASYGASGSTGNSNASALLFDFQS